MAMHDLTCTHPKPKYTRKDYILVAKVLHTAHQYTKYQVAFNQVISDICVVFAEDNHLFSRERFLTAVYQGKLSHR